MLMERILSRGNLLFALKRVERNKGSHGVDEMSVQNLENISDINLFDMRMIAISMSEQNEQEIA